MAGTAPHAEPMHGHGVHRLPLQPVDPHIRHAGFRVFGDHKPQGDHPTRVPWPGADQGDVVEVDRVAFEDLLPAGGCQITVGFGLHQIPEHSGELLGFAESLRRAWLLQEGQPRAKVLQLLGPFETHAPDHSFHGAEGVHRHRHRRPDHVLEQQGGSPLGEHAVCNGRQFKIGVHRCCDPFQLSALIQQLQKSAQVAGGRARSEQGHGGDEEITVDLGTVSHADDERGHADLLFPRSGGDAGGCQP